ncbi:complement factor H-related protein 3-like [Suncus etruscus]|uniref:complement factor H-related protein 3-like n=1 Tax=Suncus etruscus TaxID=109475 RepID=UPI00211019FA|nr:complement factor H-related protein 3-like [Suncus etruscus]
MQLLIIVLTVWASCAHGQGRTCDFPVIKHGGINDGDRYKQMFPVDTGKYFYYSCDHNYASPPQLIWTRITCTEEGWSPTPQCLRHCILPWVENGDSEKSGKVLLEGEMAQIDCKAGYSLSNNLKTIACTENGWSTPPICSLYRTSCDIPVIRNGFLLDGTMSRRIRLYGCLENFLTPSKRKMGIIRCTPTGWEPKVPCIRKCTFNNLENGENPQTEEIYYQGQSINVQCHSDFRLQNQENIMTCTENGWNPHPICVPRKSCNRPVFENAWTQNNASWFKINNQLQYNCSPGYEDKDGNTTGSIMCGDHGWSDKPTCFDPQEKCGPPPAIDNGDITSMPLKKYVPRSQVEYQCQSYYKLQGNRYIVCRKGEWSTPPNCLDPCIISEETMNKHNIQIQKTDGETIYFQSGEPVKFMCKHGYRRQSEPNLFQATCVKGKIVYPKCE